MANKFVLVAIGGTGMRVAQSFVALCASGMLTDMFGSDDYDLEIRTVDLDIVAGSDKIELETMIADYNAAIPFMTNHDSRWNPVKILPVKSFTAHINDQSTLDTTLQEPLLTQNDRLLYQALYHQPDRDMNLRRGCKGRPRIGSLLWAKEFLDDWNNNPDGFWRSIANAPAGTNIRIMFAGSVFGGTGASGIPTLAQLFRHKCLIDHGAIAHVASNIGMTLMLPYFSFPPAEGDVDCSLFSINSKLALKYYEKSSALNGIQFVQLVGDEPRQMMSKQINGSWATVLPDANREQESGQNNPSMPAELEAAVGICRFFADDALPQTPEVSVPLKYTTPDEAPVQMPLVFDHFESHGPASNHRVFSVQDYVLRLERMYLMLNVYYRIAADAKYAWRPESLRRAWGRDKGLQKTYISNDSKNGMGIPLRFFDDIMRWLEELDQHGMHHLLHIGEDLNSLGISALVARCGEKGVADFDLCGINCSSITRRMDNIETNATPRAFTLLLMDCCASADN